MFEKGKRNPRKRRAESDAAASSEEWRSEEERELVAACQFFGFEAGCMTVSQAEEAARFISYRLLSPSRSPKAVQSKAARLSSLGSEAPDEADPETPVLEWFAAAPEAERLRFLRALLPLLTSAERELLRSRCEQRSVVPASSCVDARRRQLKEKAAAVLASALHFFAAGDEHDSDSLTEGFAIVFESRLDLLHAICRRVDDARIYRDYRDAVATRIQPMLMSLGAMIKSYIAVSDRTWTAFLRPLLEPLVPILGFEMIPSLNAVRQLTRDFSSSFRASLVETTSASARRALWFLAPSIIRVLLLFPSVRASVRGSKIAVEWGADGREIYKDYFQVAFFIKLLGIPCLTNSVYNIHTAGLLDGDEDYHEISQHGGAFFASVRTMTTIDLDDGCLAVQHAWCLDGSLARVVCGRSSASSRNPIRMFSFNQEQAQDLAVIREADITAEGTDSDARLFEAAVSAGRLKESDRSAWAAAHGGNMRKNVIGFDSRDVFPGTLHWKLRGFGSVCSKIVSLASSLGHRDAILADFRTNKIFCTIVFHGDSPVVELRGKHVRQLNACYSNMFHCLNAEGRQRVVHEIFRQLFNAFRVLLDRNASPKDVAVVAVLLRTAVAMISFAFGRRAIIPSLAEAAHSGAFYLQRAIDFGASCGLKLTLWDFSEESFEAKHEEGQLCAAQRSNHRRVDVLNSIICNEWMEFGIKETVLRSDTGFGPLSTHARACAAQQEAAAAGGTGAVKALISSPASEDETEPSDLVVVECCDDDDDGVGPCPYPPHNPSYLVEEMPDSDDEDDDDVSNNEHHQPLAPHPSAGDVAQPDAPDATVASPSELPLPPLPRARTTELSKPAVRAGSWSATTDVRVRFTTRKLVVELCPPCEPARQFCLAYDRLLGIDICSAGATVGIEIQLRWPPVFRQQAPPKPPKAAPPAATPPRRTVRRKSFVACADFSGGTISTERILRISAPGTPNAARLRELAQRVAAIARLCERGIDRSLPEGFSAAEQQTAATASQLFPLLTHPDAVTDACRKLAVLGATSPTLANWVSEFVEIRAELEAKLLRPVPGSATPAAASASVASSAPPATILPSSPPAPAAPPTPPAAPASSAVPPPAATPCASSNTAATEPPGSPPAKRVRRQLDDVDCEWTPSPGRSTFGRCIKPRQYD